MIPHTTNRQGFTKVDLLLLLAILVTPPVHGCNDLSFCTVDWNPEAPDMEAGIWGKTELETTGPIALRNPYVKTILPLPATNSARLTVYADAINATNATVTAKIRGTIRKPGKPTISFGSTSRATPRSACTPPNDTLMSLTARAAVPCSFPMEDLFR